MSLVLVINCGSSSLKYSLIDPQTGESISHGLAERLGTETADLVIEDGLEILLPHASHASALEEILRRLGDVTIIGVGHRVVHGGERFHESVIIDDAVEEDIQICGELAPLHNPANLVGIQAARTRFPDVVHVAVFDTAFHQTLPAATYLYAIPYAMYENLKVRRYGFHGTSHRYVAQQAAQILDRPLKDLQLLTAHLGNGCSACAIKGGKSTDTTMGLTPLEGLVMGTRSGDVDPNFHEFIAHHTGKTLGEITAILNRESGLLGLSGLSNDMRTLTEAAHQGHTRADLAIEVFCYRLAKYLLGLCASLERVDALVFTGGIGEHSAEIRQRTLQHLRLLGVELDPALNDLHGRTAQGRITSKTSRLCCLVVPTNEELVIARETARFARSS